MNKDYLESVKQQMLAQQAQANLKAQESANQVQAVAGAIQMLEQLIKAEDMIAAGGNIPAQGVTGPGV